MARGTFTQLTSSLPISCAIPYVRGPLWRELCGYSVALLPARPYCASYVSGRHLLGFTFEAQQGVDAFGGDSRHPFRAEPWRLAFTPAGCDVFSASDRGGEYLLLSVTPGLFDEIAAAANARRRPAQLTRFSNRMSAQFTPVAHALRRWVLSGEWIGTLALEESGVRAIEIAAGHLGAGTAPTARVTPQRMRRILEYLEANLSGEVRLADLARELRLSASYLARAFKATTGMTLHAALMERRLALARRLISGSGARRWSLAHVAAECGFASHAHLCVTFRRALGLTPGRWRELSARAQTP